MIDGSMVSSSVREKRQHRLGLISLNDTEWLNVFQEPFGLEMCHDPGVVISSPAVSRPFIDSSFGVFPIEKSDGFWVIHVHTDSRRIGIPRACNLDSSFPIDDACKIRLQLTALAVQLHSYRPRAL